VLNSVTGLRQWWDDIYTYYLKTALQEKYSCCAKFTLKKITGTLAKKYPIKIDPNAKHICER